MDCKLIDVSTEAHPETYAIVDPCDFDFLNQWQWRVNDQNYVIRTVTFDGKQYIRRMHRIVADAPEEIHVDHKNGNKLDNRRANLRLVTPRQNSLNRSRNEKRARGVVYKGVYSNKNASTYTARINVRGKHTYLGSFKTQIEAARAYDRAAREHYGEFAKLNFPGEEWW